MRLRVLNKDYTIDIKNAESEIMEIINKELNQTNFYFSHFIVNDEVEIYDDFELYIEENLNNIKKLEVVAMSKEQFITELLLSIQQYLRQSLPQIQKLCERLYVDQSSEPWVQVNEMLEGLQWIQQATQTIDQSKDILKNWDMYFLQFCKLQDNLVQLEEAIIHQDMIFLADVIKYEMLSTLENLLLSIDAVIDVEVKFNNVSR